MACDGLKPVLAIYSTFLQRYDQLIHDVALQELDVTLAIDRGLVGRMAPHTMAHLTCRGACAQHGNWHTQRREGVPANASEAGLKRTCCRALPQR